MTDFIDLILEPLREVFLNFKAFAPNLLAMLLILIIGIILSRIIRMIVVKLLIATKFDSWSDRMGFTKLMRKGNLWAKPSIIFGGIIFWVLIIITLMTALSALNVSVISHLVEQFFGYIPRVISAVIILIAGYLISGFVSRAVLISAVNSGLHSAKLLAEAVRTLLTVLILAMAMEQLQIAPSIILASFSILFGGIVVALAIAFGVGGIGVARRIIEKEIVEKQAAEERDDVEHI